MAFQLIHENQCRALFIPFKGENVDGHRFITQALNDGAGAVFSEKENKHSEGTKVLLFG